METIISIIFGLIAIFIILRRFIKRNNIHTRANLIEKLNHDNDGRSISFEIKEDVFVLIINLEKYHSKLSERFNYNETINELQVGLQRPFAIEALFNNFLIDMINDNPITARKYLVKSGFFKYRLLLLNGEISIYTDQFIIRPY